MDWKTYKSVYYRQKAPLKIANTHAHALNMLLENAQRIFLAFYLAFPMKPCPQLHLKEKQKTSNPKGIW